MSISKRQFKEMMDAKKLTISPYNESDLGDNYYLLHNNGKVMYHPQMYQDIASVTMDSTSPEAMSEVDIPKTGLVLESHTIYQMRTKELVTCNRGCLRVTTPRDLAALGVDITTSANVQYAGDGQPITVSITSRNPIRIYANQVLAEMYLEDNEPDVGQVPIGGIIMFNGSSSEVPWGYAVCDGRSVTYDGRTRTTPDLSGKFIMATTPGGQGHGGQVSTGLGPSYYRLAFLMRYR